MSNIPTLENISRQYQQPPAEIQFEGILPAARQLSADNFNVDNDGSSTKSRSPDTCSATISDSESVISAGSWSGNDPASSDSNSARFGVEEDLIRLEETDTARSVIQHRLMSCLGRAGETADVVAIHRKKWTSFPGHARLDAFLICFRAMVSQRGGGDGNNPQGLMKYAWFGSSKPRIERIMTYGFSHEDVTHNNGLFGRGVYLSPADAAIQSVESATADEDGVKHILLCRVLVGRSEVINPGSGQSYPSSSEFDSGIDSELSPRNYVIWTANMNTYILPEYVISFRLRSSPSGGGGVRRRRGMVDSNRNNGVRLPTSPWMPLPTLISTLSDYLPAESVGLITKYHKQFKERKMSRPELIKRVRGIAGDKLLSGIIKTFRRT